MSPAGGAAPCLLDANVLIALVDAAHVHHDQAVRWFSASPAPFATCPITQGAFLRVLLRVGAVADGTAAACVLAAFVSHPRHQFWADELDCSRLAWGGVLGHRQVTDAYLAALARHRGGRLVTFDRGLAALHGDVAELIAQ